MSRQPQHIGKAVGFSLKQMGLEITVAPPPKAPPPELSPIRCPESKEKPQLKGQGAIKIKINRLMMSWLYECMKKQVIITLMFGKKSPEGIAASEEIKRLRSLRKAFALFFLLKAHYDDGFNWALIKDVAVKLNVSVNTLRSRLATLFEYKLVYEQHNVIKCYAFDRARAQMGIAPAANDTRYLRIKTDLKTFDYALDALYERDRSQSIRNATTAKIRQNEELARELVIVCGELGIHATPSTVNRQHIQDAQAVAFVNSELCLNPESLALLYHFNVNEHPSYAHLSRLFGYKSLGGMAYRKRKWVQLGLADIHHRQYADRAAKIRPQTVKRAGHGHYSRPHKATMFHQVDKIKLLI